MSKKVLATAVVLLFLAHGVIAETYYNSANSPAVAESLLIPGTSRLLLPERFSHLSPSSVVPVRLPFGRLKTMKIGETVSLVLPGDARQFTVIHDNRYTHPNKDITWVGYIREIGISYRVIITFGLKGSVVGSIDTPRGKYLLDTVKKQTYIINVASSGAKQIMGQDDQILAGQSVPLSESSVAGTDTPVVEIPADQLTATRVNDMVAAARQSAKDRKEDTIFIVRVKARK